MKTQPKWIFTLLLAIATAGVTPGHAQGTNHRTERAKRSAVKRLAPVRRISTDNDANFTPILDTHSARRFVDHGSSGPTSVERPKPSRRWFYAQLCLNRSSPMDASLRAVARPLVA